MKTRILLALGLGALNASSADLPSLTFGEGVGVNIHFTRGHERDLDMIREAGFKFIRMDFSWHGTEPRKGEYNWSAYDELTTNLQKRGIRALYILDYSNPLYEEALPSKNPITGKDQRETASPQHPESVAAFARWAAAAARHFQDKRVVWEIWNEPNIFFWKPKPDVEQYTTLALATAKAIRQADPNATIIGPATSTFPWDFLETFFKAGVLDFIDGVSVHPYRSKNKPPETAAADYAKLRALIEKYAPSEAKKKLPIISGEWGYSSHAKNVSPQVQAAFLARQQLGNVLHGVPLSIWYDWKNDGRDPNENEHNFGTVTDTLEPKPAYAAAQTLTKQLAGFNIKQRVPMPLTNDFVLVLTNRAGETRMAAWTLGEPHTLPANARTFGNASAVDVTGQPVTLTNSGGKPILPVSGNPIYIRFR